MEQCQYDKPQNTGIGSRKSLPWHIQQIDGIWYGPKELATMSAA